MSIPLSDVVCDLREDRASLSCSEFVKEALLDHIEIELRLMTPVEISIRAAIYEHFYDRRQKEHASDGS